MGKIGSTFDGLKRRYFRNEFNVRCRAVLKTAPVALNESSGVLVLSQSYHKDLILYLIAAKTFAKYVQPAQFIIVDDGYTIEDQQLIRTHLVNVIFVPRRSVSSEACPKGGTWERLLTIADYCKDHFVIQLDSDIVTFQDPVEVRDCIARNASFTLSTGQGKDFISIEQAAAAMIHVDSRHIQVAAERALTRVPDLAGTQYIRGCSGFAGFARGAINRGSVERLSRLMSQELGKERWGEWGSEQFASNYLIANTPLKSVLPFEKYPYWAPGAQTHQARLMHFIGEHRFTSTAYRRLALMSLKVL